MQKYIAFLRGINVSGHHKVPMAELRSEMERLKFKNVVTLLNSGNVIFDADTDDIMSLDRTISQHLEATFGFPIPITVRSAIGLATLIDSNPFKKIAITTDTRLYVSFLWEKTEVELKMPWSSEDASFQILAIADRTIITVLDLSIANTPKAMGGLEKIYGKNMTTRNWNTVLKIGKKLKATG